MEQSIGLICVVDCYPSSWLEIGLAAAAVFASTIANRWITLPLTAALTVTTLVFFDLAFRATVFGAPLVAGLSYFLGTADTWLWLAQLYGLVLPAALVLFGIKRLALRAIGSGSRA